MAFLIPLALIAVPLIEIALFIQVGRLIDLWPTLALVVLTALVGGFLLRVQGVGTLARAQAAMRAGDVPVRELFDGLCIVIGGILLLTPGFLTDTIGIALLLPPVRTALRLFLARRVEVRTADPGRPGPGGEGGGRRGPVIDADYREIDDKTDGTDRTDDTDERGGRRDDPPPPSSSRWGRR